MTTSGNDTATRPASDDTRQQLALRKLLVHSVVYTLVIALLALFAFLVTANQRWVLWVALGWGLGLVVHAVRSFLGAAR